jgi:iron complex transport system substrate-binding protein
MRIVSLLPSATEIVCALGLQSSLVGVTHECDFPPAVLNLPKVTHSLIPKDASSAEIDALVSSRLKTSVALYTLNMPVLEALRPDVLITQALCDVCAVSEEEVSDAACRLPGRPRVLNLEPQTLEQVFETMLVVGKATDVESTAEEAVAALQRRVDAVSRVTAQIPQALRPRVAFLEWLDPPFNGGHWNPSLIELAGGVDLLGEANMPSRRMDWSAVSAADPDLLFISCCGFSVERTMQDMPILAGRQGWNEMRCVREKRVYITDGNAYFSRPGPRLVDALELLAHTLHPKIHPESSGRVEGWLGSS